MVDTEPPTYANGISQPEPRGSYYRLQYNYTRQYCISILYTCAGVTDVEEVLTFPDADPYLAEDKAFLTAVTSRDATHVLSSYSDAAKTYSLTWDIRAASAC